MNLKNCFYCLILFSILPFVNFAQETEEDTENEADKLKYTFTKDRQFLRITDFSNQIFVPKELQSGENPISIIAEGDVAIFFTNNSISFKGVEGYDKLSITSKQAWKSRDVSGYEFQWMDYRDPSISGTLRVITDKKKFVELLYINGKKTKEYTFFLPVPNKIQFEDEKLHFTRKSTINARTYERLVGQKIKPYRVINDVRDAQIEEKINIDDDSYIQFFDGRIDYVHGNFDKKYTVKKAKTYEYTDPNFPFAKFVISVTCKEIKEKINIYLNSKNQIERIDVRHARFTLFPD